MKYKSPFDFDLSKMTIEEVREHLKARGIEPNQWVHNERTAKAQLPTLKAYAKILEEIGGVVEQQIERDVQEVDRMQYQLHRLKHGGGK